MLTPRRFALLGSLLFCVVSPPVGWTATPEHPNVLFIAVDDMRPELGAYGNKVVKTPNIDRLAARGIVFDHAYCQQAVCSPSRSSLLTGRRPDATKVWDLETHFRVALPDAVTLPQYFKEHGYHCAALSKIFHVGFEDGRSWNEPHWYPGGYSVDVDPNDWTKKTRIEYGKGTNEFKGGDPEDNDRPTKVDRKGKTKGPAFEASKHDDDELPDGFTAAEAVRRLHALKDSKNPFFLAVGFLKPHLPFVCPKKYWDLYDPEKIPRPAIDHLPEGAPEFAGHTNGELHAYANIPEGNPIPEPLAKTLRHGYYACLSYTDAQIGRLLDALDREGLAKSTVVILWGDHGWQLGDHGLWHKHTNFELATRAPLILSVPGQKTAGQHAAAPVEFIDIYPTLAEVCGLPAPAGLDGTSLKKMVDDPTASVIPAALSQYPRTVAESGHIMGYTARDARWRLTLWKSKTNGETIATELYDEQNDPVETKNLATNPGNEAVIANLTKFIDGIAKPTEKADREHALKKGEGKALSKPQAKGDAKKDGGHDREKMFQTRDANHDGQLTFDEFMKNQPDPDGAKARFPGFDKNHDGVLSHDEFVNSEK